MTRKIAILILLATGIASAQTIGERMQAELLNNGFRDDDDLDFPLLENEQSKGAGTKSTWKALGLSLILPGAGQYYAEDKHRAMVFGAAEALVWSGFFGLRIYGGWKKEDYRAWAAFKAGADVNGKSESYFEKMTYYDNLDQYNQFERLYEGSRAEIFPDTPEYYWNWDSDQSRQHFRDLRNASKNAYRRSLLFLGAGVINRILSGIDAFRSASSFNRQSEFTQSGWKVEYACEGPLEDGRIGLKLTARF